MKMEHRINGTSMGNVAIKKDSFVKEFIMK